MRVDPIDVKTEPEQRHGYVLTKINGKKLYFTKAKITVGGGWKKEDGTRTPPCISIIGEDCKIGEIHMKAHPEVVAQVSDQIGMIFKNVEVNDQPRIIGVEMFDVITEENNGSK